MELRLCDRNYKLHQIDKQRLSVQIYVVFSVMGGHNANLTPSLRSERSLEWNVNELTIYKKVTPTHDMGLHDTEWNWEIW